IELIFPDDDEIEVAADHLLDDVLSPGEEVADDLVRAEERLIGDLLGGGDRDAVDVEVFLIEGSSDFAVTIAHFGEEALRGGGDRERTIVLVRARGSGQNERKKKRAPSMRLEDREENVHVGSSREG